MLRFIAQVKRLIQSLLGKRRQRVAPSFRPAKLAPTERVPHDPAEHAVQFAMDWYDRFEMYSRRRMLELGIRGDRVGAYDVNYNFRHAAFFPKERTGGENSPGARINLNSGVLNPDLLMGRFAPEAARRWCTARLRDRIDAVIVHEDIEGQRIAGGETLEAAHAAAVSLAPGTPRPISEGARLILRAMAELGER